MDLSRLFYDFLFQVPALFQNSVSLEQERTVGQGKSRSICSKLGICATKHIFARANPEVGIVSCKQCLCTTSHNPRQSRGLGKALKGQGTDNAPQGAFSYAFEFLLPVNRSINFSRLIGSAILSSSNWCRMYSSICFLFRPTVFT